MRTLLSHFPDVPVIEIIIMKPISSASRGGTDVCNCWFFLLKGRRPVLRRQLLQLCAEDDSRGKGFSPRAERLSETCGWWEGEAGAQLWRREEELWSNICISNVGTAGRDVAGSEEFLREKENQLPAEENTPQPLCLVARQPERKRSSSF